MARKMLWAVVVVGLMLVAAPFALGMPSKASAGQKMMDGFRPLMQQKNVDKTAAYYNDVFVPLGQVVPAMGQANVDKFSAYVSGFVAMGVDARNLVPALAQALHMTPTQVQAFMAGQFPAMSKILQNLPAMQKDFDQLVGLMRSNVNIFGQVPAGLKHYQPLVTTMQANVGNYKKADQLQPFVQERGKILPRRMTGTCSRHQRWLGEAIKRARNIALLPFATEL